ncbi:LysR family transcriptional regulator [Streptomyces sp. NPDC088801]|uniref:LysR family transcriptional regulator n=1 Tax=Streptomyces sp. NPDC088801 TaxID=3365903 RepID=UPI00380AE0F3
MVNVSWDLRQLECFLAVAEERHFRKAAERLHLSPASVSEAVAGLERRLGGRLFDRSTRRVRLTPHGARFLDDVQEPYERLRRAHEFARARSKDRAGISIAYTPELGHLFLPSLLARSPSSEPSTAVAFRPSLVHTAQQIREIEDGALDIGLCWSPAVQHPLTAVPLCKIPVVAVLREDDPLAASSAIPLGELLGRRVLVVSRRDNPFIEARRRTSFVQAGVITPDVEEVLRYDELAVQVATGDRVGLHPATLALTNRIPGVVFRRVVEPSLFETICVLTHVPPARHPDVDTVLTTLTRVAAELDGDRLRSLLTPAPTKPVPVQLTA